MINFLSDPTDYDGNMVSVSSLMFEFLSLSFLTTNSSSVGECPSSSSVSITKTKAHSNKWLKSGNKFCCVSLLKTTCKIKATIHNRNMVSGWVLWPALKSFWFKLWLQSYKLIKAEMDKKKDKDPKQAAALIAKVELIMNTDLQKHYLKSSSGSHVILYTYDFS